MKSDSFAAMAAGAGFVPAIYSASPAKYVYFIAIVVYAIALFLDCRRATK